MMTNIVLLVGTCVFAVLLLNFRLLRWRQWRATATPLASIIGSGFLLVGPLLANTAGTMAWLAMTALCAMGYLFGEVMRYNIVHVEPQIASMPEFGVQIERLSYLALALSYFISVGYYLNLLGAFALRVVGVEDPTAIRICATIAIATVGLIGFRGGLRWLERIETVVVGVKLSIIGALLLTLTLAFTQAAMHHTLIAPQAGKPFTEAVRITLGLVILVQGFETSRFLSKEYDGATRVRTMRAAQIISTAIYIPFVVLLTHLYTDGLSKIGAETEIIDMLRPLGTAVAPLLIVAALASQSSAAIADMNGAGGLINEISKQRLSVKLGNLTTALAAAAITWSADIFQIVTYASKAFVAYYGLQAVQATHCAIASRDYLRATLFACAAALSLIVILWAIPAAA